jgi:hypothetical protein
VDVHEQADHAAHVVGVEDVVENLVVVAGHRQGQVTSARV